MAPTKTVPWDAAEHLQTKLDMAAYLEATLQDDDPALVAAALGDIAHAKGMTQLARDTGLGREGSLTDLAHARVVVNALDGEAADVAVAAATSSHGNSSASPLR